ncbi:hypothetical protein SISSUDRAFT_793870 [Sistotremastrum suecicum HHB10207 ss-3]|uniref:Uncharacterized protein n=1 Tax=Sistotremastrum suecicum HHB10207 ss-3 TaxID=1314776 RepID=A0A166HNT8_9AGAM|nr:hypothetical protein SISSUDRAFT_793870 [Sistotremastrum suecicum HHB10207 ss-3]
MAAFSRLQLAAALLEYDNDASNPNAQWRSANDSAIFSHLRRRNLNPKSKELRVSGEGRRSTDNSSSRNAPSPRSSQAFESRRSRMSSVDMLHNPFGGDIVEEEDDHPPVVEEEPEVDLASWGLDSFMPAKPKEKPRRKTVRSKTAPAPLPNPHSPVGGTSQFPDSRRSNPVQTSTLRTQSLTYDDFGVGALTPAGLRPSSDSPNLPHRRVQSMNLDQLASRELNFRSLQEGARRKSFGSRLDAEYTDNAPQFAHPSSLIAGHPDSSPRNRSPSFSPQLVPFPSSSEPVEETEEPHNPFALPPPPPERASRFDPKVVEHARTASNATRVSRIMHQDIEGRTHSESSGSPHTSGFRVENEPSGSRLSGQIVDGDIRDRRESAISQLQIEARSQSPIVADAQRPQNNRRDSRLASRIELMRPKVLIMPAPLRPANSTPDDLQTVRDGFAVSKDGPPLPPGAKTAVRPGIRPLSTSLSASMSRIPLASDSFSTNPRLSMSLSQLTFRNSLMVGGQRDVAYADIDAALPRALEDGVQIEAPPIAEEDIGLEPEPEPDRAPGKLYGRSLIDDLENRKASMRAKQRVFTGDQRPSMMERGSLQRRNTLIDPAEFETKGANPVVQPVKPALNRTSSFGKPLVQLDDSEAPARGSRMIKSSSVFGVDTLWEREMAKLKEIEAVEAAAEEERARLEAQKAARRAKKGKGKAEPVLRQEPPSKAQPPRISEEPPVLPQVQLTKPKSTPVLDSDSDSDDESDDPSDRISRLGVDAKQWHAGDSDEERRPLPTVRQLPSQRAPQSDDDDEDMPLAAHLARAKQRPRMARTNADDSDEEDEPLAAMVQRAKGQKTASEAEISPSTLLPPIPQVADGDDDDDIPLALKRQSSMPLSALQSTNSQVDEDDLPLGLKQNPQRGQQFLLAQQQHQQMMMQAQLRHSFAFGPPSSLLSAQMGPYGPTLSPMMMPPAPQPFMPMAPQVNEAGKYGRVDQWRRGVE